MTSSPPLHIVQLGEGDVGRLGVTKRDVGMWVLMSCGVIVRKFRSWLAAAKFKTKVENHGK